MECPICGSDDFDILNSKQKSSKKKITEEYLLKCVDCGHVFKNVVSSKKPQLYRVIISKQGESIKTFIELSPNDELAVGDSLLTEEGQVEITSIEIENKRVKKALVEDIVTIWANSVEIPARIGFSVDLHGEVDINWIWTGISRYLQKTLLKLISTLLEYMLLKHRNVKLLQDLQELK